MPLFTDNLHERKKFRHNLPHFNVDITYISADDKEVAPTATACCFPSAIMACQNVITHNLIM